MYSSEWVLVKQHEGRRPSTQSSCMFHHFSFWSDLGNKLGPEGMKSLSTCLSSLTSLAHLDLGCKLLNFAHAFMWNVIFFMWEMMYSKALRFFSWMYSMCLCEWVLVRQHEGRRPSTIIMFHHFLSLFFMCMMWCSEWAWTWWNEISQYLPLVSHVIDLSKLGM